MLLGSPVVAKVETVNDADGFLVNFWRATRRDPVAVAGWADWPVSEIDLESRHSWLVNRTERLRWSLEDPDFDDPKIAGWWVWGACAWIGSGWCLGRGPWVGTGANLREGDGRGINRQLPHLSAGQGINRKHLGDRLEFIIEWFTRLSERTRNVRITCGDWQRILTPAVTTRHGVTAVFLDPPYTDEEITEGLYRHESGVSKSVREWCVVNGDDPQLRIALCGYEGEHELPGWKCVQGQAGSGAGYGGQGENENHKRERIWFSPNCVSTDYGLFQSNSSGP